MKLKDLLRKQLINRRVIVATLPCVAGGVYFFGWRSLAVVLVACAVGLFGEWLFCRRRKEPVSEAVFVTGILFALIIPPTVGWNVVILGMLVAIIIGKEVFGGYGRNIFNPAMAGRCFVYICYPIAMTAVWVPNVCNLPDAPWYGALDQWSTQQVSAAEASALRAENADEAGRAPGIDLNARWQVTGDPRIQAFTGASPLGELKSRTLLAKELQASGAPPEKVALAETIVAEDQLRYRDLLLGTSSGSMGVTSALLILIGGAYLYITKTANRTIILSVLISCYVFSQALYMFGVRPGADGVRTLISGGFLFGAFFMATDPISSAKTPVGRIIYGCIIGVGRVVIQNFSVFNGGFMFALLLANMFAPSIDAMVKAAAAAKKAKLAAAGGEATVA